MDSACTYMYEFPWVTKRAVLASEIAQKINDVRACISNALSRFATAATTLNLLHTIQVSIECELSKLPKANAEYYVKSKPECQPHATKSGIQSDGTQESICLVTWFWNREDRGIASTLKAAVLWRRRSFGIRIEKALDWTPLNALESVTGSVPERQMKVWVIDPMRELKDVLSSGKHRSVIVLDGLHECGDLEVLESLVKLVLMLPPMFTVLVSCSPERLVVSAWGES
ncbi:uncharacterized protein EI90DRAFT_1861720 [Cantharellus anzutake]|uniref:uncharacterized protein n=1 Tax=Cantharellus anzutake TaxID=1750568 RepID=UPI00190860F1|nr:uncharacterized protein EI90DRAFT_1861720 [Cantharellus anzutake]KAF8308291.1 hypothetical protein EI90DRAFT_1861720 [Cantharellus anzutake]